MYILCHPGVLVLPAHLFAASSRCVNVYIDQIADATSNAVQKLSTSHLPILLIELTDV